MLHFLILPFRKDTFLQQVYNKVPKILQFLYQDCIRNEMRELFHSQDRGYLPSKDISYTKCLLVMVVEQLILSQTYIADEMLQYTELHSCQEYTNH